MTTIKEEQEIDLAVKRMIESINDVLQRTESAARRAQAPALYDLRTACQYKGVSYETVRKHNHLQPLCGFYTHWEDTPQTRKPKWTREQVDRWARITKPQRIDYIEELLFGEDSEVAAGALHMLISERVSKKLPEYIWDVIDEYTEQVKGRAV